MVLLCGCEMVRRARACGVSLVSGRGEGKERRRPAGEPTTVEQREGRAVAARGVGDGNTEGDGRRRSAAGRWLEETKIGVVLPLV